MHSLKEIESITEETRSDIYSSHGVSEKQNPTAIQGFCHENAIALAESLHNSGYDPIVVWGALTENNSSLTIKETEKQGITHLWIEIPNQNLTAKQCENDITTKDTIVADPYAIGQNEGTLYVSFSLPPDYRRIKGGFIWYKSWMTPSHFLSMRSYTDLPERVFVFEKMID